MDGRRSTHLQINDLTLNAHRERRRLIDTNVLKEGKKRKYIYIYIKDNSIIEEVRTYITGMDCKG